MNESTSSPAPSTCDLGSTLGFLVLRLWLALRAILTGIEKYAGTTTTDAAVEIDGAVNEYGQHVPKILDIENWGGFVSEMTEAHS